MLESLTADAFVARVAGFDAKSIAMQTDLLALYLLEHGGASEVNASALASLREALHLSSHTRLPSYLSEQTKKRAGQAGKYVKTRKGYVLERGFAAKLRASALGRPAARNVSAGLRGTLYAISDPAVRAYLEEAIGCFELDFLRSAVVMTWCVAFGLLRSWLFRNHLAALNSTMAGWKVPASIGTLDDFQDFTEATIIDTARKAGLISKEQTKTLKHLLDQRNSYAHPTLKPITASMAEAYIEAVLKEIVPTFG